MIASVRIRTVVQRFYASQFHVCSVHHVVLVAKHAKKPAEPPHWCGHTLNCDAASQPWLRWIHAVYRMDFISQLKGAQQWVSKEDILQLIQREDTKNAASNELVQADVTDHFVEYTQIISTMQ